MKNKSNVEKRVSKVKKILRWKISLPEPGFEPTTFWSTSSCRHCFLLMVAGLLLSHQVAQTRSQYPGGPCSGHQQATSAKTRAFPGPVHPAELPTICWTKYLLRAFIPYIGTSCTLVGSNQQSWKFGEKNCSQSRWISDGKNIPISCLGIGISIFRFTVRTPFLQVWQHLLQPL